MKEKGMQSTTKGFTTNECSLESCPILKAAKAESPVVDESGFPTAILPCPFCGAEGTTEGYNGKRVGCSAGFNGSCWLGIFTLPINAWNKRAT